MERSALSNDWIVTGGFIASATQEMAMELGGQELAEKIGNSIVPETGIPDPSIFEVLEGMRPGSISLILSRAEEIQAQTHRRERHELRKQLRRDSRRAILKGIAFISLTGKPLRKL